LKILAANDTIEHNNYAKVFAKASSSQSDSSQSARAPSAGNYLAGQKCDISYQRQLS
jgi:hypothetical protein